MLSFMLMIYLYIHKIFWKDICLLVEVISGVFEYLNVKGIFIFLSFENTKNFV